MKNTFNQIATLIAVITMALVCAPSVAGQESPQLTEELKSFKEEIKSLKAAQQATQQQLREIKELLQANPAAAHTPSQPVNITIGDEPTLGNHDARVVLVDFSDYQCPFCGKFVQETLPLLEREYISTGKIRYVFRDLPLETLHPNAFAAAEAAHCAGEQGKYWEMHNRLYQNQDGLGADNLAIYAQALGLDRTRFTQCLNSGKFAAAVRNGIGAAETAGIQGTPSFMIGLASDDAKDQNVKVLKLIIGAQPYAAFKDAIDRALATVN